MVSFGDFWLELFDHVLLREGKIPQELGFSKFSDNFQTWPPWNKFTESRKPHHPIWQHYNSFNIDAEFVVDIGLMPKNYKAFVGFFVAVNVCTRLLSAEPIKSRQKQDLIVALNTIIEKTGIKPQCIYTDKEPALRSTDFKKYVLDKGIETVFTNSLHKVGLAE